MTRISTSRKAFDELIRDWRLVGLPHKSKVFTRSKIQHTTYTKFVIRLASCWSQQRRTQDSPISSRKCSLDQFLTNCPILMEANPIRQGPSPYRFEIIPTTKIWRDLYGALDWETSLKLGWAHIYAKTRIEPKTHSAQEEELNNKISFWVALFHPIA